MKPKIFGLGLSRTGTTTLTKVLNETGLKLIHYPSKEDLFSFNNDGATDIPVIPVYKQLDQSFPNSKFILTVRDKDEWMSKIEPYLERKKQWNQSQTQVETRVKVYGAPFFDKKSYSKAYDDHHKDVEKYFSKRKKDLLILNIIDGDSPKKLFDFLGIDNPPLEFPVTNKLKP